MEEETKEKGIRSGLLAQSLLLLVHSVLIGILINQKSRKIVYDSDLFSNLCIWWKWWNSHNFFQATKNTLRRDIAKKLTGKISHLVLKRYLAYEWSSRVVGKRSSMKPRSVVESSNSATTAGPSHRGRFLRGLSKKSRSPQKMLLLFRKVWRSIRLWAELLLSASLAFVAEKRSQKISSASFFSEKGIVVAVLACWAPSSPVTYGKYWLVYSCQILGSSVVTGFVVFVY